MVTRLRLGKETYNTQCVLQERFFYNMRLGAFYTEGSHSSEPFFTQVNHLVSSNRISKQVMNPADFSTLKIWDKSDHWFKSYGSKVNF